MAVRVLVTDGSSAIRERIRRHLECIGCDIVAEAETAAQALTLFRTVQPEIVILGADLGYGDQSNPLELVRLIKREMPETSVLMIARELLPRDARNVSDGRRFGMFHRAVRICEPVAHLIDGASAADGGNVCHHDVGDGGAQG